MPATPPLRARVGLRLAQLGALLHVVGGATDLSMTALQPFHEAFLEVGPGGAPAPVAALILALLHALGAALVAAGAAMWTLLTHHRRSGARWAALVAAALAVGAEGMVGIQMLGLGLHFGAIPAAIAGLVVVGVALMLLPRPGFVGDRG
ncbi:MAG: hypothetical protein R3B09_21735 [Nannocystaceae bacterium]